LIFSDFSLFKRIIILCALKKDVAQEYYDDGKCSTLSEPRHYSEETGFPLAVIPGKHVEKRMSQLYDTKE
jgi:hypothetical protein